MMTVPEDNSMPAENEETPPVHAQGRRGQRQWQTRMQLIKGARDVFAQVGVAQATIAQITTAADVGFGTFYLYFKTKDDALRAVLVEGFTHLNAEVDVIQRHANAQGQPWEETLHAIVVAYLRFTLENRDLMQIMFAEQVRVQQAELQVFLRFAWRIVQLLKQARPASAPDIVTADPIANGLAANAIAYPFNLLTAMIVAILNRSAMWWLRQQTMQNAEERPSLDVVGTTISSFITAGLSSVLAIDIDQDLSGKDKNYDEKAHE